MPAPEPRKRFLMSRSRDGDPANEMPSPPPRDGSTQASVMKALPSGSSCHPGRRVISLRDGQIVSDVDSGVYEVEPA